VSVQMLKRIDRARPLKRVPAKQVGRTFARCKPLFFALGDETRQRIIVLLEKAESLNVT